MVTSVLPLTLSGATVRKAGRTILGPVDATIGGTGITVIMGPNGAGKTTLLRAMHGLERLRSGTVQWAMPEPAARHLQAFVFQTPVLMRRTVRDNIAYPLHVAGHTKAAARAEAEEWALRVGLDGLLDHPARSLSAGERQKMALARALIRAPQVLFLDEPCANLDGHATTEIERLLTEAASGGTRLVMATHDLGQARRLARDVLFLNRGQLVETGEAAAFFAEPTTDAARAFLRGDIVT